MPSLCACWAIRTAAFSPRGQAAARDRPGRGRPSSTSRGGGRASASRRAVFSPETRAHGEGDTPFQAELPTRARLGHSEGAPPALRFAFAAPSPSSSASGLEALVILLGDWHDRYPGVAVAAGSARRSAGRRAAAGSGAGSSWPARAGRSISSSSQTSPCGALIALPAWLAVGALAGWLATSRRRTARERSLVSGELTAVRDSAAEAHHRHRPRRDDHELERGRGGALRLRGRTRRSASRSRSLAPEEPTTRSR